MGSLFRGLGFGAGVLRFGATRFGADVYVSDTLREYVIYQFMSVLSSTKPRRSRTL